MAAQESCIQINSSSLFSSFPPSSPVSLLGVLTLNDVLSKCIPPVSLVLLSIGACLVNPPGWLTCWSKLGATSRCLHLFALEHVRHFGFAVPLQGDVGLAFMFLCCSVVGLVLTVKNTCDVSNPVQVSFHFHRLCLCMCMWVWFCCFHGNSGINAHVMRTAGKGSLFSRCFSFPVKFVPCVPLLPPIKY